MSRVRIGINGFGRIGRCVHRIAAGRDDVEVVGINDLADPHGLAYLARFDSVHGRAAAPVTVDESGDEVALVFGDERVPFSQEREPAKVPWGRWGADVVIEATGVFRKRAQAAGHLDGGAGRVIISAPSPDADAMVVVGVNDGILDLEAHRVVSNASCTTNCISPVAKVLVDAFGVERILMTTIHAYTSTQAILDVPHKARRRGRAGALSIIPTTTGAAKAAAKIIPELEGRIDGMALRVPVPDGSVTDIVARLERDATVDEIHTALRTAAEGPMAGVLSVSDDELVSVDIVGNPHSSIIDAPSTMMLGSRDVKLLAWYDNEWGYSSRLVDLALLLAH